MTYNSKVMCGIILLTVPTIQYGGYFILQILSGEYASLELNSFQKAMFRAGHGHAGILVILSLIAQYLSDYIDVKKTTEWFVRLAFPLSATLISGGFFASALGTNVRQPTEMIIILYGGVVMLAVALITLGVSLILNRNQN